jgi:hypothetical protein
MKTTLKTLRRIDRDTWATMTFITFWTLIIVGTR